MIGLDGIAFAFALVLSGIPKCDRGPVNGGFAELVQEFLIAIEQEAARLYRFAVAGAFLRGVGIPDCVQAGESAAEAIFSHFAPRD